MDEWMSPVNYVTNFSLNETTDSVSFYRQKFTSIIQNIQYHEIGARLVTCFFVVILTLIGQTVSQSRAHSCQNIDIGKLNRRQKVEFSFGATNLHSPRHLENNHVTGSSHRVRLGHCRERTGCLYTPPTSQWRQWAEDGRNNTAEDDLHSRDRNVWYKYLGNWREIVILAILITVETSTV